MLLGMYSKTTKYIGAVRVWACWVSVTSMCGTAVYMLLVVAVDSSSVDQFLTYSSHPMELAGDTDFWELFG